MKEYFNNIVWLTYLPIGVGEVYASSHSYFTVGSGGAGGDGEEGKSEIVKYIWILILENCLFYLFPDKLAKDCGHMASQHSKV